MRIGIDVDGVLADFTGKCAEVCKTFFGLEALDLSSWGLGLSKEQERKFWAYVKATPNFWRTLRPLSEDPIYPNGNVLYFVTSRVQSAGMSVEDQTVLWLLEHQPYAVFPQVIVGSNKGEICKALRLEAFVDDRPENIYDILQGSSKTAAFLMDRPWNQHITDLERVKSVREFFERING